MKFAREQCSQVVVLTPLTSCSYQLSIHHTMLPQIHSSTKKNYIIEVHYI